MARAATRRWLLGAATALGVGLCALLIARQPLAEVGAVLSRLGWIWLLAPACGLGWIAASAMCLHALIGGRAPRAALVWNRVVGEGYNTLLPLAGVAGEPFKMRHLSRWLTPDRATAALVRDRLVDNGVGLALAGGSALFGALHYQPPPAIEPVLIGFGGVALVLAPVHLALVVSRIPGRIGTRIAGWLGGSLGDGDLAPPPAVLWRAVGWQVVGRALSVVEVLILMAALDIETGPARACFVAGVLSASGFLGFFLPQALGAYESGAAIAFATIGEPGAAAVAFAVARRGRMLLVAGSGVALHAIVSMRTARRARAEAPAAGPRHPTAPPRQAAAADRRAEAEPGD